MEFKIKDIISMKKPHPCGSYDWEIIRIGADVKIKCCKCNHLVMLPLVKLKKRVKKITKSEI